MNVSKRRLDMAWKLAPTVLDPFAQIAENVAVRLHELCHPLLDRLFVDLLGDRKLASSVTSTPAAPRKQDLLAVSPFLKALSNMPSRPATKSKSVTV